MPTIALVLLMACGSDSILAYPVGDGDDDDSDDSGEDTSGWDAGGTDGGGDGGGGDGGGGDGGGADGGGSDGGGSDLPAPGELVLTELMIDAAAVSDEHGEWVELYNASDRSISLDGLVLGDDNVDAWPLDGGVSVAAGDYAVLCADTASGANGGVSCDGSFHYNTWGEGFALANAGDEVKLSLDDGTVIDRMTYSDGQVSPGVALGVDPDKVDAAANDAAGAWCLQDSPLSGGDQGTPGRVNDGC